MKKLIPGTIACALACSCTTRNPNISPTTYDAAQLVRIDLTAPIEVEDLAPIEEKVVETHVVQLETNDQSFIRDITKLFVTDDRIVVFDQYNMKHQIIVFGNNGAWVASSQQGQGPGEIIKAYCATYDYDKNIIAVRQHNAFSLFDKNLKFIKTVPCNILFNSFAIHDGEYILKAANFQAEEQTIKEVKDCKIIITDSTIQYQKSFHPIWRNHETLYNHDLENTSDGVIISEFMCDTLYQYNKGVFMPKYVLDYSDKLSVPKELDDEESKEYRKSHKKERFFIGHYKQTDNVQYFYIKGGTREDPSEMNTYRNIATGSCLSVLSKKGALCLTPATTFGNQFVSVISQDFLEGNIETLRKILSPDDFKKVEEMSEESNPMLLFYRIDI